MHNATMMRHKAALRARALAQRDALGGDERRRANMAITARVLALLARSGPAVVLAYASFGSEFSTADFIGAVLDAGHTLALPRIDRETRRLGLYRVSEPAAQLVAGRWGIAEPDPARCAAVDLSSLDFVLVPGVVFDRAGGRIGYGGGFYDKLFADCGAQGRTPLKVAPAFACQVVDTVPVEPHDVPVDHVVTEQVSHPKLAHRGAAARECLTHSD